MLNMVTVSPQLINKHLASKLLKNAYQLLEEDDEVLQLLKTSNIMAVTRLKYNDHGLTHARIVAGAALETLSILEEVNIEMSTIRDGITSSIDEVKLIVLLAAYLHDIGNSIHRHRHEFIGALLAKDVVDRILSKLGYELKTAIPIRQEVLHAIYSTEYDVPCLSIECGVVKVSDGLDMAEGRARVPYRLGNITMHSISALSIKKVDIIRGDERPIKVNVYMNNIAGLFQLEEVLLPKINTSSIGDYLEVNAIYLNNTLKFYPR